MSALRCVTRTARSLSGPAVSRRLATVASDSPITYTSEGAVSISYPTLVNSPLSLTTSIAKAFGSQPDCLGIVVVRDLPSSYVVARERLLKLAYCFANLDHEVREHYADPRSKYSFGWSHGKETMNGRPDTLKGSYYANPIVDTPDVTAGQREAYPEYHGTNIWPTNDLHGLEGFEDAFKILGRFVFKVGTELATACQPFASSHLTDTSVSLADLIRTSQTTKARLLHYFAPSSDAALPAEDEPIDSWCGFHIDHSLLTGLCSASSLRESYHAMFVRPGPAGKPVIIQSPSPTSGLYIRTRGGDLTKVSIPSDCLAFQTGEALELATAGSLRATPHCVRVGAGAGTDSVSRETFALFMQPDTNQRIAASETFGQFSKRVFERHYGQEAAAQQ
ncbi:Clavaminate synthase-like protein [Fomitopsis serialis]|uniref:Clavaminate synthase-like protein n=1 Tax=Fomitopsis serialis TaxID=139415 RepID=UPI0020074BE9|nr:Clavaminate synthase-like protein [Neoantrodia serialis]KAH9937403.1 Clavaminate synthase-like protein [Neoantrodia serialis]